MSQRCFLPLLVGLIFWSLQSLAFQYEVVADKLTRTSPLQNSDFSSWFAKKGYRSLSSLGVRSSKLAFDFAFVSPRFERAILLKAGLRAPIDMQNKIIYEKAAGLTVLNFEVETTPYVLVALNIPKSEVQDLFQPWLMSSGSSARWRFLLPQRAEAASTCLSTGKSEWGGPLKETATHIDQTEILQSIGRCGAQAMQGASSSALETLTFFKKLATDPKSLWVEMKDSFVELKNFALNIQQEMGPILETLRGLSSEEKMQIACNLSGQLVSSSVQALVSGAALAKVLPMMLLKLKAVSQLLAKIALMEQRGISSVKNKGLVETVIRCEL